MKQKMKKFFDFVKKYIDKILYGAGLLFALISVLLMFAPAGVLDFITTRVNFTGAQMAFGYTEHDLTVFAASANILTYILLFIGIIAAVIGIFGKFGKIPCLVSAGCLLLGGIFYFCMVPFCSSDLQSGLALGAGAIAGGIFALLASLCCLANLIFKPKK